MTAVELAADGAVGLDEAATLTGVKRSKLYELMGQGKLAYAKIGSRRLIPRRALTALIASNIVGGREPAAGSGGGKARKRTRQAQPA
jgi:excisionase family DNA binding protein